MEHIFGILGNHPSSDLINYAAKLIDNSDDQILSRIAYENTEIITFGNGIEKTFKTNKKTHGFSFQLGEIIPPKKTFIPDANYDYSISRLSDGCFVAGYVNELRKNISLCTDPFGLHPLYYITDNTNIIFSSSQNLLINASMINLTLDMTGICQFIHFDHCLGPRTFFNEIKRFEQGVELRYNLNTDELTWHKHYQWPVVKKTIKESKEAIPLLKQALFRSIKRRVANRKNVICLLSSGYDSRTLSSILKQLDIDFDTHTTYGDEGLLVDPMGAKLVSDALGVSNKYYDLPANYLENNWKEKAISINHETMMHSWLLPMAKELPRGGFNLDGLAGDNLITTPKPVSNDYLWKLVCGEWDEMKESIFSWYWPKDSINRVLKNEFLEELNDDLHNSFMLEFKDISESQNLYLVYILRNRIRRAIGCSPTSLLSTNVINSMPFFDKKFVEICFQIDDRIKFRNRLYKILVDDIAPLLADIPTSHNSEWPEPFSVERRKPYRFESPEPLQSYLDEIAKVPQLFSKYMDNEWLINANAACLQGPEQRAEYMKEAQALGEVCFVINSYHSFLISN